MNKRFALWPVNIRGNFCIVAVVMATAATHCLSTVHNHLCTVTKWRFAEMDVSSALNNFSGTFNIPNFPNWYTFAALKADGSIAVRGSSNRGGEGAPSGNDSVIYQ
jgi:hypothetical protein